MNKKPKFMKKSRQLGHLSTFEQLVANLEYCELLTGEDALNQRSLLRLFRITGSWNNEQKRLVAKLLRKNSKAKGLDF